MRSRNLGRRDLQGLEAARSLAAPRLRLLLANILPSPPFLSSPPSVMAVKVSAIAQKRNAPLHSLDRSLAHLRQVRRDQWEATTGEGGARMLLTFHLARQIGHHQRHLSSAFAFKGGGHADADSVAVRCIASWQCRSGGCRIHSPIHSRTKCRSQSHLTTRGGAISSFPRNGRFQTLVILEKCYEIGSVTFNGKKKGIVR